MMDTDATLAQKLTRLFDDPAERREVKAVLDTYDAADLSPEATRVKLAILKLAGDNRHEIAKYTACARRDFRDVLSWAEYPRQCRQPSMPGGPAKDKVKREDRAEYEHWLRK